MTQSTGNMLPSAAQATNINRATEILQLHQQKMKEDQIRYREQYLEGLDKMEEELYKEFEEYMRRYNKPKGKISIDAVRSIQWAYKEAVIILAERVANKIQQGGWTMNVDVKYDKASYYSFSQLHLYYEEITLPRYKQSFSFRNCIIQKIKKLVTKN